MEGGLHFYVDAVSRDVSPDLYCDEVMTSGAMSADASPMPSPINRSWCVKSDFPFFLNDVPGTEKLCARRHVDCYSCPVRRAVADFEVQHGRYLNDANEITGKGPFQMHNRGTTGGVTCFFCLTNYERDMPLCSCMPSIKLGDVERPLRRLLRQKIKAREGEKFYARFNQDPLVLSRYVGAGPRYEKEPQHRTRPGDKDGDGGPASSTKSMPDQRAGGSEGPVGEPWQWEQLYFEYEVGKACRCVGEWCACDYSKTKMMPDELNKRRKKLRATDPCST